MALSAVRLAAPVQAGPGATVVAYTVPAGKRAILRDARVSRTGVAGDTQLYINPVAGGAPNVRLIHLPAMPANSTAELADAFVVLTAGDAVQLVSGLGDAFVWLSGHEFTV